ncbi:hypothetical protein B296_00005756 [Ensete ventricosum]|uniref:ACT domain-containing protein n=1 Tax=Ensete ventricosum TaxID=4639 RepID=A0A427AHA5_ENSVE|nr:hypothetical protein B296_00005756 [Ensete ventricosum]
MANEGGELSGPTRFGQIFQVRVCNLGGRQRAPSYDCNLGVSDHLTTQLLLYLSSHPLQPSNPATFLSTLLLSLLFFRPTHSLFLAFHSMSRRAAAAAAAGEGDGGGGEDRRLGLGSDDQHWIFSNTENSDGGCNVKVAATRAPDRSCSNSPTGPVPLMGEKRAHNGASKGSSEGKGGVGESDHEMHIWTERERRKKMRNMFSMNYIKTLQQNLQKLQKKKHERTGGVVYDEPSPAAALQSQASDTNREAFLADRGKFWPAAMNSPTAVSVTRFPQSFQTWSSPNVVLSVTGEDAHISVCTSRKPGLFSTILCVMEKHKLEVVSATISSDCFRSIFMIHARATGASDQFPETLMIEEIYKLAVGEMILWLSSC